MTKILTMISKMMKMKRRKNKNLPQNQLKANLKIKENLNSTTIKALNKEETSHGKTKVLNKEETATETSKVETSPGKTKVLNKEVTTTGRATTIKEESLSTKEENLSTNIEVICPI